MSEMTYDVTVPVTVRITVTDEPVGDGEPMHPLDPRRMKGIYDLDTPEDMLDHLAFNAISNGKGCASGLDGWGDIYVATNVEGFADWPRWKRAAYIEENHPVRMRIIDVEASDFIIPSPPDSVM